MALYSSSDLSRRDKIIQTHKLFGNFLDSTVINNLVYLFDDKTNNNTYNRITKYIEDERKLRGLDDSNVIIKSEVYGHNANNSTLYLEIKKNNIDFLHFSMHLVAKELKPQKDGLIHMFKEFYLKQSSPAKRRLLYALILVQQPLGKPNSLEFSIAEGYTTPSEVKDTHLYDSDIQKEMDVIITVLNRLFDEDNDEYYIGNKNTILYPIHSTTNLVLNNINSHSALTTRKNKGKMLAYNTISKNAEIDVNYKTQYAAQYKPKNKKRGTFRKLVYPLKNKKRGITIRKIVK